MLQDCALRRTRNSPPNNMKGISTGAVDNNYDYGQSLKSHPESILNLSEVIYPFQPTNTIMNGMNSDELQHTLMDMNGVNNNGNGNGNNNHNNNNTMINE
eukprot:527242_1